MTGRTDSGRLRAIALGLGLMVVVAAIGGAVWAGIGPLGGEGGAAGGLLPLSDEAVGGEADSAANTATTVTTAAMVSTTTSAPAPTTTLVVPPGGSLVATSRTAADSEVPVWADPADDEPAWMLPAITEFGSARHFLVLEEGPEWLKVAVPVRPNGSVGWVPRDDVDLSVSEFRVRIRLADRSFQVWRNDELVIDTTSAVGNDRAPTPLGEFYIRDIFAWDPDSVYGPWVLALSAYSEHIDQINGGDAVVAIHGTNRPDLIGQAVSLGCIRLENADVTRLAETVPVGTPVEIVG